VHKCCSPRVENCKGNNPTLRVGAVCVCVCLSGMGGQMVAGHIVRMKTNLRATVQTVVDVGLGTSSIVCPLSSSPERKKIMLLSLYCLVNKLTCQFSLSH